MDGTIQHEPLGKLIEISRKDETRVHPQLGRSFTWPTIQWRFLPGQALVGQIPTNRHLDLESLEACGQRRFAPRDGLEHFLPHAWSIGVAILGLRDGWKNELSDWHRFAWFATQKAWRLQPYLKRNFRGPKDLSLTPSARCSPEENHLVPVVVDGQRWNLQRLLEEGRAEAQQRGENKPNWERLVHLGLIRGAEQAPLSSPRDDVPTLIRNALFDANPALPQPSSETIQHVRDRLRRAFKKHLNDASSAFDKWYFGGHSGLVNQIAKQKKAPGGVLDRDEVSAALVEIGWTSFASVAECVEATMKEFASLLPTPLKPDEQQQFEAMYYCQPWLGGLSLVLLRDRLQFLRDALVSLWDEPTSPHRIGVVHRMLAYYAAMASEAREADRRRKARKLHPLSDASAGGPGTSPTGARPGGGRQLDESQVEQLGLQCDCVSPQWHLYAEDSRGTRGRCECHGCGASAMLRRKPRPK